MAFKQDLSIASLSFLKGSKTGRVFERVLARERADVRVKKREGTAF